MADHIFHDIARTLSAYLRGQFKVALILSALYAVGFALLEMPAWPVVAIVCGFLNMAPLGTALGMVLALFLESVAGREFWQIAMVAVVFAVVSGLEAYYITPRILGRHLGLRPLIVFLVLLFGGALFGFWGLLLAAPAAAVFNVFWKSFHTPSNRQIEARGNR